MSSAPPDGPDLVVERDGPVGVVSLNRPERYNAVRPDMVDPLRNALLDLEADPAVRAIVLAGRGKAFCGGADISGETGEASAELRDLWNPLVLTMVGLDVPLIAAVGGVAAGAGVSLALACDLRVATPAARFQLSFVKVGLSPDAGATWLLPRIVGLGRANDLALTGRDVSADEALSWGLINELVTEGTATEAAVRLAARFGELSASAGTIKAMHHHGLAEGLAEHLEREAETQGGLQRQPDFAEATRAFQEKRRPAYQARRPRGRG